MKKTISIILLFSILVTLFAGCSLFGDNISGTWEAEIDLTEHFTSEVKKAIGEENTDITQYLALKDLKIKSVAKFSEDGSYEISVDSESVKNAINALADQIVSNANEALKAAAAEFSIDEEALSAIIAKELDSLKAEYSDEIISGMADAMSAKGFYKLKDGKLYTAKTADALETAGYETYELANDTLTLSKGDGMEDTYSETIGTLYPIVYKRKSE